MIDGIKKFFIIFHYIVEYCLIILAIILVYSYCRKSIYTEENIKETIIADSIIKVNDSIKIKVERLDSIKNAKVIEVQTLDNDSTLKLFYKLVSE